MALDGPGASLSVRLWVAEDYLDRRGTLYQLNEPESRETSFMSTLTSTFNVPNPTNSPHNPPNNS